MGRENEVRNGVFFFNMIFESFVKLFTFYDDPWVDDLNS